MDFDGSRIDAPSPVAERGWPGTVEGWRQSRRRRSKPKTASDQGSAEQEREPSAEVEDAHQIDDTV